MVRPFCRAQSERFSVTSPHALYCPVQAAWPLWSGPFLRGAGVVAVVPGQRVERQGFGFVDPQRVLVDVVGALVFGLGQQADRLLA